VFIQQTTFANELDSLFTALENEMSKREYYDRKKENRIDSLVQSLSKINRPIEKYELISEIIEEYRYFDFNKALYYLERNIEIAEELGDDLLLNKSKLSLGLLLVDTGRYKESIDALNSIKRHYLQESLIDDYYIAYKESYSGLSFYTAVKWNRENYELLYSSYRDSLFSRLDPQSEEALRLSEKAFRDQRQVEKALLVNDVRLSKVKMGSREFSLIRFERSLLFELQGNTQQQKKNLLLSAISDIRASVKDNASMGVLATLMFQENAIEKAHDYINFSFDDAEFYNSQLRFINIANSLPYITKAYEKTRTKQNEELKQLLILISVLASFLLVAIFIVFKQYKKILIARNKLEEAIEQLNETNAKLKESNIELKQLYKELSDLDRVKEHYIGTFLNLYSEYITKLDVYRKLVRKYVNKNQMNSLLELSKSKQFIDEELEIFNKNFDDSFLHIYPDFVDRVNELLIPNHNIQLKDKNKLNTDLRILALIKLGITNSSRIAKILRYSVNTIYNYRANIKSQAKNKSDFEDLIKNL